MSDIALRLDGLLLGAVLSVLIILFAAIALVSAMRGWLAEPGKQRPRRMGKLSAGMAIGNAAALALLVVYLDEFGTPMSGPDWIDWLILPWLLVTAACVAVLLRERRPSLPPV